MDDRLASIDLGSNTFRLSIGRVVRHDGKAQIYAEDKLREVVNIASGLDEYKRLRPEAVARAIAALERFGERLKGFPPSNVRAVATNTFRVARNAAEILPQAERALGFPIEIISGQEEARLIFAGVANELPPSDQRRLVIDIGGGSTEFIIGQGCKPLRLASLTIGCTTHTRAYFPHGRITESRMRQAILGARREIEAIARPYRHTGWDKAYGSSGTAKGLLAVLTENGLSQRAITLEGMERLRAALIRAGEVRLQDWAGLKAERAPVLAGGLAIMIAAFQELNIDAMGAGEGALRVGVLYDLLGRDLQHDKRDETVRQFAKRYQVDEAQAARVSALALALFDQVGLEAEPEYEDLRRALAWTASLHECGLAIAHADYHKHSAYILEHADMPGFSRDDQELLAFLALGHQGKLGKLRHRSPSRARWLTLCCLRLAVLMHRRREEAAGPLPLRLHAHGTQLDIAIDRHWLSAHPLSEFTLRAEIEIWRKAGFELRLTRTAPQAA